MGQKVAIVTPVPGTTRDVIRGILSREDGQVVFVDTPGVAKPRTLLSRRLNELVHSSWHGVDVVCFVVDAKAGIGGGDRYIAAELARIDVSVVCVVNKQDAVGRAQMLPTLETAAALGPWREVVPVSARTGANVAHLADVLVELLPDGPALYPDDVRTDLDPLRQVGEVLREKFLTRVFDEIPHSIAVVVEDIADADDRDDLVNVTATVYVERDSQKGIVIGKGGTVLRDANTQARRELETVLGKKVFLDVRVKVAKEWQRDPKRLERFGY